MNIPKNPELIKGEIADYYLNENGILFPELARILRVWV